MRVSVKIPLIALTAAGLSLAAGCHNGTGGANQIITLNAAGATFPYPLYSKWISAYNRLHPNIHINYQSIGSGGGIRQITARTVDFGASDAPMTDEELAKAPGKLLHIPTTLGAVVVAYNLPKVPTGLKLTGDILANIYLGKITKWNDPQITGLNSGLKLPDQTITVVHRSDGSGTTNVFTDYLSHVSPAWKAKVGKGKSVNWPVGLGAKGNEGVTGQVKTAPGGIGYVELAYAMQNHLTVVSLKNEAGNFVMPSLAGISSAAAGVADHMPADFRVSIVDAPGAQTWPISAFTYLLVYQNMKDPTKAKTLANFLWWAEHDGQKLSPALEYAPLPAQVVTKVEAALRTLKVNGQVLLADKGE